MSKQDTIDVRNALFDIGGGKSLDDVLTGSIMAQVKMVVAYSDTPEQANAILERYFGIALSAVPTYWREKGESQ